MKVIAQLTKMASALSPQQLDMLKLVLDSKAFLVTNRQYGTYVFKRTSNAVYDLIGLHAKASPHSILRLSDTDKWTCSCPQAKFKPAECKHITLFRAVVSECELHPPQPLPPQS
jgi:hypothetical protein